MLEGSVLYEALCVRKNCKLSVVLAVLVSVVLVVLVLVP